MDGRRWNSRLSRFRQELCGAMRGAARPAGGRADARCCACLDVAWDRSLSRQEKSRSSYGGKACRRAALARGGGVQRSVANRSDRAGQERRVAEHGTTPQLAWAATGKPAVFPRKDGAAAAVLAARTDPDRAAHRTVFLSPKSDQGHERSNRAQL